MPVLGLGLRLSVLGLRLGFQVLGLGLFPWAISPWRWPRLGLSVLGLVLGSCP